MAAGDVTVDVIEETDHVAATVAVQAASDELVGDDGGVIGAFHGTGSDFAVALQGGGDAGDGEVAVVGQEEPELDVRGEVVEDHLAVGDFPVFGGRGGLAVGGLGKALMKMQ